MKSLHHYDQVLNSMRRLGIAAIALTLMALVRLAWPAAVDGKVVVLDISRAGAAATEALKNATATRRWVEMGDQLLVATDVQSIHEFAEVAPVLEVLAGVRLDHLATRSIVHCITHAAHKLDLPVLYRHGGHALLQLPNAADKLSAVQLLTLRSQHATPWVENRVLSLRFSNRKGPAPVDKDPRVEAMLAEVDAERWFAGVHELARYDRQTITGLTAAAAWVENEFLALGLSTERQGFGVRGDLNVIALQPGPDPAADWFVVGAHLDSRNEDFNDSAPSPGAEDNATGCSGVLEIARIMSTRAVEANIAYVCFGAEEIGLIGSQEMLRLWGQAGIYGPITAMLNLDMIGFALNAATTGVIGTTAEHEDFGTFVGLTGELYTGRGLFLDLASCCSDHMSFINRGIPATLTIESDFSRYPGYHTTVDTSDNIDLDLGADLVRINLAALALLTGADSAGTLIGPSFSGLWYNTDQPGHGLSVEILPEQRINVFWYTFDASGEQLWLLGTGTYAGSTAQLEVVEPVGGRFPPQFDPAEVDVRAWGRFELQFHSCDQGIFTWEPSDATLARGELTIARLTGLAGLSCNKRLEP